MHASAEPLPSSGGDIYVDLDGTLSRTDTFLESLLRVVRRKPFTALRILALALKDKAGAKTLAAFHDRRASDRLAYHEGLLQYLHEQKAAGRSITLATASHWTVARRVARRHLGLFDAVIASTRRNNLKGVHKLASIHARAEGAPFCYAGDSHADAPIWAAAGAGVYVNAPGVLVRRAQASGSAERVFTGDRPLWRELLRAARPHQWAKNLLVFVPLITSHSYTSLSAIGCAILAFVSISLCASGVYVLNDLADIDADRQHPKKRFRPIASGAVPIATAVAVVAAFAVGAVLVGSLIPHPWFLACLASYAVTTTAYSFFIKRKAVADVITLAGLYTLRMVAGAAAISVAISFWLIAFSMFFFLGLAYVKRYAELREAGAEQLPGRGYGRSDADTVFTMGVASGYASVIVFALYINSDQVTLEYSTPQLLWFMGAAQLYWVNRIWMKARRGLMDQDPILFALRDRQSLACVLFCGLVLMAARLIQL